MRKIIQVILVITIQHLTLSVQNSFAQVPNDNLGSGNCLSFDGTNDYVSVPNHSSLNFGTGNFSVQFWVRATNAPVFYIMKDIPGIANPSWFFYGDGTNLRFVVGTSGADYAAWSAAINDGDWHHISGTRESGVANGVKIYVDGVLQGTTTDDGGSVSNSSTMFMGSNVGSGYFLSGSMDDIRIWNRALTQTEIRDNMCNPLVGNEAGLVGYWNMNEGTGSTANDLTSNANHATRY